MKRLAVNLFLAAFLCSGCGRHWDTSRFEGPATPVYNPDGGWARYQINFKPIDVSQSGVHTMTFSGAPNWTLRFHLAANGYESTRRLQQSRTAVHVELRDEAGDVIASHGGALADEWRLSEPSFMFQSPLVIRFHHEQTYQFSVEVEADDEIDQPIYLEPRWWGGSDW